MCKSDASILFDAAEYGDVANPGSTSNFRSDEGAASCTVSVASKEEPNRGFWRTIVLTMLILGFAASANAGVQLYSGEIIVHMRGSDAAGNFIGIPFGNHCNMNPYHAEHTAMFDYTNPTRTYTLTIPNFEGQVPVIDTNMDSIPDVAAGCAPASLHAGLPLTGGGTLATTGSASATRTAYDPRGFTIPMSRRSCSTRSCCGFIGCAICRKCANDPRPAS